MVLAEFSNKLVQPCVCARENLLHLLSQPRGHPRACQGKRVCRDILYSPNIAFVLKTDLDDQAKLIFKFRERGSEQASRTGWPRIVFQVLDFSQI